MALSTTITKRDRCQQETYADFGCSHQGGAPLAALQAIAGRGSPASLVTVLHDTYRVKGRSVQRASGQWLTENDFMARPGLVPAALIASRDPRSRSVVRSEHA